MLNSKTLKVIRKYYYGAASQNRQKSGDYGFGLMHYALIRNFKPQRILVVGSRRGYIPAICALACKNEGRGHVDFVDEGGTRWAGDGVWATATADYWKPLCLQDWITLHVMRIEDFKTSIPYQYIYLDADHSYEGASAHFDLLWSALDRGGLFLFHDILGEQETQWGKFGVSRLWRELCDEHADEEFALPLSAGLGIIRKL